MSTATAKVKWAPRQKSASEKARNKRSSMQHKTNVSSFANAARKTKTNDRDSTISTIEENEEILKQSCATKLRFFLITSWVGVALDIFDAVFSIIACLMYVAETYYRDAGLDVPKGLIDAEVLLCVFFLVHFSLQFFVSVNRCSFVLSAHSITDILIIFPPLIFAIIKATDSGGVNETNLAEQLEKNNFFVLMRIFRVLRIVRVSRELSKSSNFDSEIAQIFFDTGVSVLTGVLIFTGVIHWIENIDYTNDWQMPTLDNGSPLCPQSLINHPNRRDVDLDGCRSTIMYHDALYFLMVTVSTVGYGDMSPQTVPGRMIIIMMISVFLLQIPVITNQLAEAFSQFSFYERAIYRPKRGGGKHVIICGSANERPIAEFMQELFHPDHRNPSLQVVILTRGPPSRSMLRLLNSVKYRATTTYLDGDVVSTKDLIRASAENCEHFFIVADPITSNPEREDSHNTLRALAIKQYVYSQGGRKATISIQMLRHESRGTYFDSVKVADYARANAHNGAAEMVQDQVICLDEIKLSLMAQGAGICTMISNLCTSMTIEKEHGNGSRWASEYLDGCGYEVYRIWLSPVFQGLQFAEVAEKVHKKTGVLLFAIELHAPRGDENRGGLTDEELSLRNSLPPRIVLNPHDFLIPNIVEYRLHAFVIAGDRTDALKVQHWGLPGFDHEDKHAGIFGALSKLKHSGSEVFKSMGSIPDYLSAHVEENQHRKEKERKKIEDKRIMMEEMENMMSGSSKNVPMKVIPESNAGAAAENKTSGYTLGRARSTPVRPKRHTTSSLDLGRGNVGKGTLLSNDAPAHNKLKPKHRRRMSFRSKLTKEEEQNLKFEEQLRELQFQEDIKKLKILKEEEKIKNKELADKRKVANKNRLMSKLKKYAVQVGEEKSDERLIEESGYDPREVALRKKRLIGRKKESILGNALSESTWERLGADVSMLDTGHHTNLADVIIETVKHLDHKMHHHIVACGPLQSLWSFIVPLRSKHVQVVQPIVVLTKYLPSVEDWERFATFPDIYIVRGSPLNISDLHAVGTSSASRAVLFADLENQHQGHGSINDTSSASSASRVDKFGDQMRDSSTILAYRALKVVNPRINVTVELISSENLRLLDESENGGATLRQGKLGQSENKEKNGEDDGMLGSLTEYFGISSAVVETTESWLSPSFASGHAFLSTVTDTIFAQSYYNGHLIAIIQELVIGTPDILAQTWNKVLGAEIGHMKDSHMYLIVVPSEYRNRSYSYVLYHLLQRGVLSMGLRRGVQQMNPKLAGMMPADEGSNSQPYVYTNPSPSTIVRQVDLLYVLCHGAPHDLGLDIALFDYQTKKTENALAMDVVAHLKSKNLFDKSGAKPKDHHSKKDTRRRMSLGGNGLTLGGGVAHGETDNVGVPKSMLAGMKFLNKFKGNKAFV